MNCPSSADDDALEVVEVVTAPSAFHRFLPPAWLVLVLIVLATFLLKLRHLDHSALTHWDEVFHAVVAQNLLKHPFEPTLIDVPYLPYDIADWKENHVWLHKPILPLWQMALSLAALGINTFALRLPSAILSTAAAWLTYLIGKELLDRPSALIAAALQAMSPFMMTVIHGYQFADHIDIALLFWVEAGIWFLLRALRTASWRDILLAGVCQGLAFLSKSYLAAIIVGLALTAWFWSALARHGLGFLGFSQRQGPGPSGAAPVQMNVARLCSLLAATLLTAGPWVVYCSIHYPQELAQEESHTWEHLTTQVSIWGAPWDRLVFDYLVCIYGVFYTPVLVAGIVLAPRVLARRHSGLVLTYAWLLGVIIPHLLAVTKTPSATVIAMPAAFLLLGYLIAQALRGEGWALAALLAILAMSVLSPAVIRAPSYGYPRPALFGGVMRKSLWVIGHVAGALAVLAIALGLWSLLRGRLTRGSGSFDRFLRTTALALSLSLLAWLVFVNARSAWHVTDRNENDPISRDTGAFVRRALSDNAVLLCEETSGHEHLSLMFYSGRTCYAAPWSGVDDMARQIVRAGGVPYIVSHRELPLVAVYENDKQGTTVYRWR